MRVLFFKASSTMSMKVREYLVTSARCSIRGISPNKRICVLLKDNS